MIAALMSIIIVSLPQHFSVILSCPGRPSFKDNLTLHLVKVAQLSLSSLFTVYICIKDPYRVLFFYNNPNEIMQIRHWSR